MRSLAIVLLAACAEPVVDMQLILPSNADAFDTSCITAVDVYINGGNYAQNEDDYTHACIEIDGPATYAAVREAIRGKFVVTIPDSGMSGIEVYGYSGPSPCTDDSPFPLDLLFTGRGEYIGQDLVDIPLVPNLDCKRSDVKLRMVDMFALVGGATCDVAGTYAGSTGASIGTISPFLFDKGSEFNGGLTGAPAAGNLVSITGPTAVGPKSCLAFDGGSSDTGFSVSCVVGGTPVCAGAGETEHATIPYVVMNNGNNYDTSIMARFPDVIFGSVWANGATKTPLANATIEVDADHAKVVYLDPPNAMGQLGTRTSTSTGPSGLFMIYTDSVVSAKVTGNGTSRTLTLSGSDEGPAGALIVMGP